MEDIRCSSLQNRPIIKSDPKLPNSAKRNYCKEQGWIKRYLDASEKGDFIGTAWAVENHYCSSREAARKHFNRQCKAGVLIAIRTYPRSYEVAKNVTLHMAGTSLRPIIDQKQKESTLRVKVSTKQNLSCQSPQKKEHSSLHAPTTISNATKTSTQTVLVSSSSASDAYRAAFPDCRCNGSYICDSCRMLPTVFTPASMLRSVMTVTIPPSVVVGPSDKRSTPPTLVPASELLRVKAPTYPRSTRYGLLGRKWHDEAPLAYDALDTLHPSADLPPVHRLYFETFDERGAFSREFETQLSRRNKLIPTDILVCFDGLTVPVHIERYKMGKVILKAELSETPISVDRVPGFMRAIHAALPVEVPPAETWRTTATDMGYDIPTTETRRRSMSGENYKGFTIHAYNKPIKGQRFLRVEVQLNPSTDNHEEYIAILERAKIVLLEACGKA